MPALTFLKTLATRHLQGSLLRGFISSSFFVFTLAEAASSNTPDPTVQLLVPLESGHELGLLLPLTPQAQLVRVNERDFVSLGRFREARIAYRLGRTIQRRTSLAFELAYDPGHADADGAWLASEPQTKQFSSVARRATPISNPSPEQAWRPSRAEQLGAPLIATKTPHPWTSPTPPLATLVAVSSQTLHQQKSLIQAVDITPVTRPSLSTVNPELHYLFVRLNAATDIATLKQHATITELTERNGQLLARVGAYYPTPRGTQLLNRQSQLLSSLGFDVAVLTSSA